MAVKWFYHGEGWNSVFTLALWSLKYHLHRLYRWIYKLKNELICDNYIYDEQPFNLTIIEMRKPVKSYIVTLNLNVLSLNY